MSVPILEAIDVVKFLGHGAGRVQALKGVNFTLVGGELALLMGPSGSGKTTLLSILGCMLTPTSGTVLIGGQSTAGATPEDLAKLRREHVGFVFQSYHLFPTLSAVDNVRLALDVRGDDAATSPRQSQGGDGGGRPRLTSFGPIRASSAAASSSGWRSPVRWSPIRRPCSPTSRPRRSTPPTARR